MATTTRYGSLFCGAGLLDHGLRRAIPSLECLFGVELNAERRAMFAAHFPGAEMFGDIGRILAALIEALR